ncbi:sulfate anion transporter 1 isoform X7 [Plutella xylostella]|uniref:sulfate anion transporter 1 isoform X7 n=1 Tax=Plutella xylostella TaxID=51655 RepID=UPI002032CC76|nr:sulfate anion transporter 1 isoform X7 [Plutella xylostella]XP_048482138.1 sulfate anion transporter 1 isoform X7 [Plutella xylostella]XP_048482139.1 sulfate anion transporter 1 isoform X7 [Plutella xylostella]XP_048482140.1 sulfate anion transporter 1 isoform X7 [Plutella xylostella]XP_048482141.1 sulfate anion transporter 1 isoform X7 [Plutella xylostella]XP_048482142.1 sulfate anion transporter 1 isoform X7 [Plutella xylostella]XP_048482143.1 sulfate anion transporter 1 isoform X7 [Plut
MKSDKDNATEQEKEKLNPSNGWLSARPSQQFNVVRRVYQQDALNRDADYQEPSAKLGKKLKKVALGCGFGACLRNSLPIARWLPRYQPRRALLGDVVAGATTAVMHIPQGMAYALLAEVPPIVGLYMAFFPTLIYVLFGTSPHISMGTFAVVCLMAGKVVLQHAHHPDLLLNVTNATLTTPPPPLGEGEYTPIQVVSVVCLVVGLFQMAMWVLRLGAVSTLLSEPLVSGFTTAASFHVLASQLKDLFGVRIRKLSGNYKVIYTVIEVVKNLPYLNWAAFTISAIACLVIALNNELLKPWVSKRSKIPVPIELIAIVTGTLVSRFWGLKEQFGVALVGHIPTGLPVPSVPPLELMPAVALDAGTITVVSYTISMSMALIFAAKEKYEVDANQELLALGSSNVFASFFGCAPFCASLSRSYIQYQAGSKTPLTTVISALLVLSVLLWLGPFFTLLPRCVLAAIIVVSLKGMFVQVKELGKFWKLSKLDALVWIVTFVVTCFVSIDIGLGAGLLASVGSLFCRSQAPYTCLLGRVADTDLYLDCKRYRAVSSSSRSYNSSARSSSQAPYTCLLGRVADTDLYLDCKRYRAVSTSSRNYNSSARSSSQAPYTCLLGRVADTDLYLDCKRYRAVSTSSRNFNSSARSSSQAPYTCLLGRVADTDLYLDCKRYRAAEEIPGIKIFHYCGGLNFASKNLFRATLFRKVGYMKPTAGEQRRDEDNNVTKADYEWDPTIHTRVKCVIIDATALSYVDAPGIKTLVAVQRELAASHITVLLAGANGPMLEMIARYNSLESDRLQLDVFPTVHDAVVYHRIMSKKAEVAVTVDA